jgi:quercetin dioxygenase-like cupin family protein
MDPVVLGPGEGRTYDLGRITATFKVDVAGCSISEWWLEPGTAGPGLHEHPEDDVFFVLGGTVHLRVADEWHEARPGAYVHVPGGVPHDFENRGTERAGFLNVSVPGGFEPAMPGIAGWFRERDGSA